MQEETLVRSSIQKIQLNQDKVAFNLLLEKYYINSCKYATKFLSGNIYSNLINWHRAEVESCVFFAFLKAVNNYKLEDKSVLSFKNYLYQLIKFHALKEVKKHFNGQCIPKVKIKWYKEDSRKKINNSLDFCINLEIKRKIEEIVKFLKTKNKIYSAIGELKRNEVESEEICKQLQITRQELKNRGDYIRRLVRKRYSYMDLSFS